MALVSVPQWVEQSAAVMVDLDGTMVDTLGDFAKAVELMLQDLKLPAIDAALIENMVGKGSEHLLQSVLTHVLDKAGVESAAAQASALLPAALDSYQKHYEQINGQFSRVYPGVIEGLDGLKQRGLRLACLTNKPTAFAIELLQAKGLGGYFECVFGGDSFERKKPDPMPLLKTCEALGTTPANTLMLGDSSNDASAARAAGCKVVLVTYGYNHGEPIRGVDADGFVDSFEELLGR